MKPWNRFAFPPAIGLLIDQKQIAMSVTVATLGGRREVAREIQSCEKHSAEAVLGRMLEPWVGAPGAKRSRVKPWVRVGLPEARVFQAALPITPSNRQHTAQNFFLEAVQATNVRAEDRIVELIKLDLDNRPLACVAASPRAVIESSIEMMSKLGTRVGLIEPGPASLHRAGAYFRKAPRGSKLCVRFFLGEIEGIGVLAAGAQPLFWHTFDLTNGDETAAILAAHSTLWMLGRHARISLPIDTVIIHGRPELALTQPQQEAFARGPEPDSSVAPSPPTTRRLLRSGSRSPIPGTAKPGSTWPARSNPRSRFVTFSPMASSLLTVPWWGPHRCS